MFTVHPHGQRQQKQFGQPQGAQTQSLKKKKISISDSKQNKNVVIGSRLNFHFPLSFIIKKNVIDMATKSLRLRCLERTF